MMHKALLFNKILVIPKGIWMVQLYCADKIEQIKA